MPCPPLPPALLALSLCLLPTCHAGAETPMDNALDAMPAGYALQACDDCGMDGRQPHLRAEGIHTYSAATVNASGKARSVAWGWKEVRAVYPGLHAGVDYVVAITYANEPYNNRVQSLWAGGICLHGPHALPRGGVERLVFRVPRKAIRGGVLELSFRLEAEVNVVVSAIELWAPLPASPVLHLPPMSALISDLRGQVLDAAWDPAPGVQVEVRRLRGRKALASTETGADGRFTVPRASFAGDGPDSALVVCASNGAQTARRTVAAADLTFDPPTFRPLPDGIPGLRRAQVSLDGEWRIDPAPDKDTLSVPLDAANWRPFQVPGQFLEQGYDVPQDRTVAVAREFTVPAAWAGKRVFLRFDAIHAGTQYFVNGKPLGESERLFTPVEFEVTDLAAPGQASRLDLAMTVNTLSERLSYASGYAFHNLGGIDRAVRLYALPRVNVNSLHLTPRVEGAAGDGSLDLALRLDNPDEAPAEGLSVEVRLVAPDGAPVTLDDARVPLGALPRGVSPASWSVRVPNPARWSAEKPNLYRLAVLLRQGARVLERVEREVGFRRIEVRGSQLYVNGARVKLTGACHHEVYPLTGRADTARWAAEDVRLMKAANLNYIRTSHYPPTAELLQEADRQGMYVEVEAPFCWVGDDDDTSHLRTVLEPTAAMVAYHQDHPSVVWWSLANESAFNPLFEQSNALVKQLDPTRPTTFNNPDPKRVCDIANLHYAGMPFDQHWPDDPRPLFMGEYFFPICHEQTDVRVDPGLRELWGAGHSAPDSAWGRDCAASYGKPCMQPGEPSGAWTSMVRSERWVGGAIWAAIDDTFYLPDGRDVGYSWVHGFWGLMDAWRRPKPEWWLSKLIFSPVWFPVREVAFTPEAGSLTVPVENRYSFTDLDELSFAWECGERSGTARVACPPGQTGELTLPWPRGARPGDVVTVRVSDLAGTLITPAAIQLGSRPPRALPQPDGGAPEVARDGDLAVITGDAYCLVLDLRTGQLVPDDPRARSALRELPRVHATRFDFADLWPGQPPYAVLPDAATRGVDGVSVEAKGEAVEVVVRDHYEGFAGSVRWRLDRAGVGQVSVDYELTGDTFEAREVGLRMLLAGECQALGWRRWSEWGVYPEDSISRTEGAAQAHRSPPAQPGDGRRAPSWPWAQDETDQGTADFRGVKLNVFDAMLTSPGGAGVGVAADADRHVRACLDAGEVALHILTQCRMGPVTMTKGEHLTATATVELLPR
jgi:beta-galactosidase